MAQSKERLIYSDVLRVFATLAVVMVHISSNQLMNVPLGSSEWNIFIMYDGLVRWCVPVFVMLSGMFMLDPKHELPLSKLLGRNALRILTALLSWGLIYAAADYWLYGPEPLSGAGLKAALLNALQGNTHYHLWFLYMILGLYLVTPILRTFVRGAERKDFHWLFFMCFLCGSVLHILFRLVPAYTGVLQTWYYHMMINVVLGYVGVYVAGYYLRAYPLEKPVRLVIYGLGILSAVFTIWGTRYHSLRTGMMKEYVFEYLSPNVVLFSVAVFVLFRYLPLDRMNAKLVRLFSRISLLSFGLYLSHDLFIMLMAEHHISPLSFSPVFSVPLLSLGVFFCGLAVSWLISRIPLLNRYLI